MIADFIFLLKHKASWTHYQISQSGLSGLLLSTYATFVVFVNPLVSGNIFMYVPTYRFYIFHETTKVA